MNNNIQSFLCIKLGLRDLPVCWKRFSIILGLSLSELLMSLPHRMPGGIYLIGFGILCQDFRAHHMISISNHREPLPHSFHTQELTFYWPNNTNKQLKKVVRYNYQNVVTMITTSLSILTYNNDFSSQIN